MLRVPDPDVELPCVVAPHAAPVLFVIFTVNANVTRLDTVGERAAATQANP